MNYKKEKNYALIISIISLAIVLAKEFHLGTLLLEILKKLSQVIFH